MEGIPISEEFPTIHSTKGGSQSNSTKHETNEFYKKERADFISGK